MKITYLHQYFNTRDMAGSTRSYEMARRLVAMGHEVNMVTSWREPDQRKSWFVTNESGIKVHWLPVLYSNHMSFKARIRAFLKFAVCSAQRAVTLDADVVLATSTPLTIGLPAVFASRWCKVPMVFEVRDLWPDVPIAIGALKSPLQIRIARALESWVYRNAAVVIALSPGMKQGVVNSGYPVKQVAVIPNSSDNDEFECDLSAAKRFRAARSWLRGRPLLVYTGTFGLMNGVGYFVELARVLLTLGPDVRLLLIGDGTERDDVIRQARDAGVYEKNLFFATNIAKRDIPVVLSAATMASSLFIDLPEMRANSANKFFDALAAGKPIFLNYGGWTHDLISKYGCGIAAWGRPLEEVAFELNRKLHDSSWLYQASNSAHLLAQTYFDRDLLAQQLEKVLNAALDGNANAAENIAAGEYT
ncbi:glycosyltransferase family 4 protein [Litorivicinus sp.]|nr:glycosyltransferase family 4 protein [Litorivicinus sp.]